VTHSVVSFRAICFAFFAVALAAFAVAGPRQSNDPFKVNVDKKKVPVAAPKESIVEPPSFEARAAECRERTGAGRSVTDLPCAYLVREVSLSGVSRSENGVEAFLAAAPSRQTIVVRAGDRLYDGRVVSIHEPDGSSEGYVVLEKTTTKAVGKKLVTSTSEVRLRLGDDTTLR
jgi:hypothetical protein